MVHGPTNKASEKQQMRAGRGCISKWKEDEAAATSGVLLFHFLAAVKFILAGGPAHAFPWALVLAWLDPSHQLGGNANATSSERPSLLSLLNPSPHPSHLAPLSRHPFLVSSEHTIFCLLTYPPIMLPPLESQLHENQDFYPETPMWYLLHRRKGGREGEEMEGPRPKRE